MKSLILHRYAVMLPCLQPLESGMGFITIYSLAVTSEHCLCYPFEVPIHFSMDHKVWRKCLIATNSEAAQLPPQKDWKSCGKTFIAYYHLTSPLNTPCHRSNHNHHVPPLRFIFAIANSAPFLTTRTPMPASSHLPQ